MPDADVELLEPGEQSGLHVRSKIEQLREWLGDRIREVGDDEVRVQVYREVQNYAASLGEEELEEVTKQ